LLVRDGLRSGARCFTRSWMSRPRSCGGGPTRSSTCVSSWSPPPRCPCETRAPLPATAHPGCAVGPRGPRRRQGTAQVRALPRPPGGPGVDHPLRGSGRRLPRSDQHPADHVALADVAVHPSRQPAGHPAGDARPVVHRVRRQRRRRDRVPALGRPQRPHRSVGPDRHQAVGPNGIHAERPALAAGQTAPARRGHASCCAACRCSAATTSPSTTARRRSDQTRQPGVVLAEPLDRIAADLAAGHVYARPWPVSRTRSRTNRTGCSPDAAPASRSATRA
jgi:hypothetical protein